MLNSTSRSTGGASNRISCGATIRPGRAGQRGELLGAGRQPGIRPPGQPLVNRPLLEQAVLRQPLVEPPRGAEQPVEQFAGRTPRRGRPQFGDQRPFGQAKQGVEIEHAVQQVKRPLQHGGRRSARRDASRPR